MENYHLFVVDENSFKYHIEYGFVGTGNSTNSFNIGLWKDITRLKVNDKVIFYVQKVKKFFGIFKVTTPPFFDASIPPYLQNQPLNIVTNSNTNIYLKYRALITNDEAFAKGIEEFELLDILPPNTENILWSILYRKLKGGRGNSPLFKMEFDIIRDKLLLLNGNSLNNPNLTYSNGKIIVGYNNNYSGSRVINVDIRNSILTNNYNEHYLHALLLEHLPPIIWGRDIKWIGNEVYSGAGMQAIDLLSIERIEEQDIFNIIEVKQTEIPPNITNQIAKYISWLKHRFNNHVVERYQPILFGAPITRSNSINSKMNRRIMEFENFNSENISKPIKYFEYRIANNNFYIDEINYSNNTFTTNTTIQI